LVCVLATSVFSGCDDTAARAAADALGAGDIDRAREIYAAGVDPDTSFDGLTALMMAACKAPPDAIEMLLEAGSDPNLIGPKGWPPITYAAQCGNAPAVRALLAGGADPALGSRFGDTALAVARAAGQEHVVAILIEAGAESDSADSSKRRSVTGY
jgi:ankyrin repeat protein